MNQQSPLDDPGIAEFVSRLIKAGESNRSIVRQVTRGFGVETSEVSIRRFRKRHALLTPGVEPAYTRIRGDEAECQTAPTEDADNDLDRMVVERGLDPIEWYIDSVLVSEWGDPKIYQTKFTAKRKQPYVGLMPVRSEGWKRPYHPLQGRDIEDSQLIVICGDHHAPFHDPKLHTLFCEWLDINRPDRGVLLGDLGDFPDISRHMADPENHCYAQESLQASYDILRGYVMASPNTLWDYLLGNHDERIRQYMIRNAPLLYPLHQVDSLTEEGREIHGLSYLLRLDELGVDLVEPHGTYEYAQVDLSDKLAVRHGWVVRQGSGASALKTLEQTGYSVIVGHTHRQSCVYHTMQEIDGTPRVTLAIEAGCMCRMDKRTGKHLQGDRYPNYAVHPDWQQGFAVAQIYPDGSFKADLATYVNGILLYRDQRYE